MPQRQPRIPFVGRTIGAPLADAFIAVAGIGKRGARPIQEQAAERTFLCQACLRGGEETGAFS
jgi:hypothetical protein